MVKTFVRLLAALISVVQSSAVLELVGATALVVGASMYSDRAAWLTAGVLLLVKAADSDGVGRS